MMKDWRSINSDFTEELKQEWESRGFSYWEVKDWIGFGLGIKEYDFAVWLRGIKEVDTKRILNSGDEKNLRQEYLIKSEKERVG